MGRVGFKKAVFVAVLLIALILSTVTVTIPSNEGVSAEEVQNQSITEIRPSDGKIVFTGSWEYPLVASTQRKGNSASYTGTFTQVDWYGEAGPYMTSANVYIDDELIINHWPVRDPSEKNAAEFLFTSGVLPRGEHTIRIEHSGNTGSWISVDKLVVYDDQVETSKVEIDDTAEEIKWSGFGAFGVPNTYYKSTVHSSKTAGAYMEYTVDSARRFVLWSDRAYTRGKADIYIDGAKMQTVDFYDGLANDVKSYPVYVSPVLSDDTHTIKVVVTGTKGKKATDCWVAIDKLDVYQYRTEQEEESKMVFDDSSFGYHGSGWSSFSNLGAFYHNNTAHSTSVVGDYFTAAFNAESIAVYGTKANNRAKAEVWLDGQLVTVIDTYSSTQTSSVVLWEATGLEEGYHEVRLVNLGATDGVGGNWLEIDKVVVDGLYEEEMFIHSLNNSFVTTISEYVEKSPVGHYRLDKGEKATVCLKGTTFSMLTEKGEIGEFSVSIDGKIAKTISLSGNEERVEIASGLDASVFHRVEIVCNNGVVCVKGLSSDDKTLESLGEEMLSRARAEIAERKNGSFSVSDPSTWKPVKYAVTAPKGGVTLNGGLFGEMTKKNDTYLTDALGKYKGVDNVEDFWVNILSGSNDGRLLQGWANMLLWGNGSNAYREAMDAKLREIRERQVKQNGYAMDYEEKAQAGYSSSTYDERRNYDRAMFTRGLVAAGNYYDAIGVPVSENLAYTILRDFYDWFNYHEKNYGASMLEGFLGVQGHIGSTLTYFTPIGVAEDITYAEYSYVQRWWMEYLSAGMDEAIWKFPLNRPHCYLITALDAYLDHYRATGDTTYLDACKSFWRMMKDSFIHTGGTMAICEHQAYPPGSYYTEAKNHTGELCGSVFWVDFNYKLLQLFPDEECYAEEIERSLINALAAAQDENGRIRYHQNLNGQKTSAGKINSCCEVTSIGLIANLPAYLYQVSDDGITVSLYNDSSISVNRNGKAFALTVDGDVTKDDKIVVRNTGDAMQLRLRIPSWASGTPTVTINGTSYNGAIEKGAYLTLDVKNNDTIELSIVKSIKAVEYNGASEIEGFDRYSFLYGPILMSVSGVGTMIDTGVEAVLSVGMNVEDFIDTINVVKECAGENAEFAFIPYYAVQRQSFSAVPLFNKEGSYIVPSLPTYDSCNTKLEMSSETLDLYSVNDTGFTIVDGKLYSSISGGEQKAIFKDFAITDGMDIYFSVSPRTENGRIDGGLYVGITDEGVGNKIDTITAYNVNVERFVGESIYSIKVHEFSYNGGNGRYLGSRAVAQFAVTSDEITVRVFVKNGWFYVYNGHDTKPCIAIKQSLVGKGLGMRVMSSTEMVFNSIVLVGKGEHDFGEWEETEAPTCVKEGKQQRVCKNCPYTESEVIPATGKHDFGEWEITESPTCVKEGKQQRVCKNCPYTESEVIPATGKHDFGEWEVTESPTCVMLGKKQRACKDCKFIENGIVRETGKHELGEWIETVRSTCVTSGEKRRFCAYCSLTEVETIPATGEHTFSDWIEVVEPTCATTGEKQRTCKICSLKEKDVIPATGNHEFGEWKEAVKPTCIKEGEKVRSCKTCMLKESDTIPASGEHVFDNWKETVKPTCIKEGEKVRSCKTCTLKETDVIPTTNDHDFSEWTETVAPSCVRQGEKERVCNICSLKESEVISATGKHDLGAWNGDSEKHWRECDECGGRFFEEKHRGGNATCVEKAKCSECFSYYGVLSEHKDTDEDFVCDVCGEQTGEPQPDSGKGNEEDGDNLSGTKGRISGGAIAGISAGSIVIIVSGGFSIVWFGIKKKSFAELVALFRRK